MLKNEHAQDRGLRASHKRDKRARIEAAARRLFKERGYERTTTRAIAQAAGVGAGTVFVYFKDKLELLFALFAGDIGTAAEEGFAGLPRGAALPEQVASVFERLYDAYERDPKLSRVIVKELMFLDDAHRGAMVELTLGFMHRLAELVKAAQARGEVAADVYPLEAANQLFAIYYYGLVIWLGGAVPSREAQRWMVRGGIDRMMRGLAPRKGCDGETG
jgi:TetR/AcrR family transcriptional regulator, cholesterol catabolism regulator